MTIEISIPFGLDNTGSIAYTSNPDGQVRQHFNSLLNTNPGERVIYGDYGIPLRDLLFEDEDTVVDDLLNDTNAAIAQWEPGITIVDIFDTDQTGQDGLVLMQLRYERNDSFTDTGLAPANSNEVTIGPGGVLDELVRG